MSKGQVGNERVMDWSTGGQSDKFYTTGRQSANGPNLSGFTVIIPNNNKNYHLFIYTALPYINIYKLWK